MDPLSVTASIVGIIAAAGKVVELVGPVVRGIKNAPGALRDVYAESTDIQAILSSLQPFLCNLSSVAPARLALIQLDQLIVTFTDAVLAFSELDLLLEPLQAGIGQALPFLTRAKWVTKQGRICDIVARLQRHKATLSLMLNIIQCHCDLEASQAQSSLETQVKQLMESHISLAESNVSLAKRLRNLEDSYDACSTIQRNPNTLRVIEDDQDDMTIITVRESCALPTSTLQEASITRFAFESTLDASRVYRRAQRGDKCDVSFTTSLARTHAWSVFSGLSIADISVLSVIALPLYLEDVGHCQHYTFGELRSTGDAAPNGVWLESRRRITIDTAAAAEYIPHDDLNFTPSVSLDRIQPSLDELSEQRPASMASESPHDPEEPYACTGCGEELVDCDAFEFAGRRWHLECYCCYACQKKLDQDHDVLVRADGTIICNTCTYIFDLYGAKVGSMILGDQTFGPAHFKCRSCKRKFENSRYVRSSEGVYCMSCHESFIARRRKSSKEKSRLKRLTSDIWN